MVEFGGWEMPLSYTEGTLAEHLACRQGAVAFDVSHLGTVRVTGDDALERLQAALTQRPGQGRPGKGAVHAPLRRRRLGARRHHRVVDRRGHLRRDAQRLQHRSGARCRRRHRRHRRPGHHRHPGPAGPCPAGHGRPGRGLRRAVPGDPVPVGGRGRASRPGPATRARTAWRWRCRSRPRCASGPTSWPPASSRPAWAPVTRCGWRPACRCTATSSARASPRSRPGSAGWWRGRSRRSGARRPSRPSAPPASPAGCAASATQGRRPPREGCPVLVDGQAVGETTSGNFSPVLGHGIALAFLPPETAEGTAVEVDVRGSRLPGEVVPTPFVAKA